ncbi:MAG: hypothetical protein PCFJNLEI_03765 [Verrucomicrobiae bacterium]|nr:hypothetical protein [Verrucomicrobiae bacterium]
MRRNLSVLLGARGLVFGLAFVNSIILARYFGPADFGLYSFAIGVTTIVFGIGDFGLAGFAARRFRLAPELRDELLAVFLRIGSVAGWVLTAGIVVVALGWARTPGERWALLAACVPQFFRTLAAPLRALLTSEERVPALAFQELGVRLGTTILLVAAVVAGANVLVVLALGGIPTAGAYWWLRRRYAATPQPGLPVGPVVREGAAFWVYAILYATYFQIDVALLERMLSLTAVGYYGVATRFVYPLLQLPAALMVTAFPRLVSGAEPALQAKLRWTLFGAAGALGIGLAGAAPWLVPWLVGEKYLAAVATLQIFSLYLPVAFLQTLNINRFLALGRGWLLAGVYGVGLVVNVVLNLWWIPRYEQNGCAAATVTAEAVVWLVSAWLLRR